MFGAAVSGMGLVWVFGFLVAGLVLCAPVAFSLDALSAVREDSAERSQRRLDALSTGLLLVAVLLCMIPYVAMREPNDALPTRTLLVALSTAAVLAAASYAIRLWSARSSK